MDDPFRTTDVCFKCDGLLYRSHAGGDMLFWKCPCGAEWVEDFRQMSDESWEWVKQLYRKEE